MKLFMRIVLTLGTVVILFSIKVMHAGRPAPYFTSPATEPSSTLRRRGWLNTWSRPAEGRTTGEYFAGWRP